MTSEKNNPQKEPNSIEKAGCLGVIILFGFIVFMGDGLYDFGIFGIILTIIVIVILLYFSSKI